MASTPTTRNRFERQGTGENAGTWGIHLNENAFDMIDEAMDGLTSIAITGNVTLSSVNYTTDQARKRVLRLIGSPGITYKVTIPSVEKFYIVHNQTDVTQNVGAGGTLASLVSGSISGVYCDGTNTYAATLASIVPVANGGTGASDAANARQNLGLGGASAVSFGSVAASSASIPIIVAGTSVTTNNLTAPGTVVLGNTTTNNLTVSGNFAAGACVTTTINTQGNQITCGAIDLSGGAVVNAGQISSNSFLNATGLRSEVGGAGKVVSTGATNITFSPTGQIFNNGVLAKTFVIDHPKDKDRFLVHACLEGPEAGVYYTGEAALDEDGNSTVELPAYFTSLVDEKTARVQVTPILSGTEWGEEVACPLATGRVSGGKFRVKALSLAAIPAQPFFWSVTAARKDVPVLTVEPLKSSVTVSGDGPYRYIR